MKNQIPTTIAPVRPVDRTITIKLDTLATVASREPYPAYLVIEAGPSKWSTDVMPTGHGAPKLKIGEWPAWYLSTLIGLRDEGLSVPGNFLSMPGTTCTNADALVVECMKRLMGVIK